MSTIGAITSETSEFAYKYEQCLLYIPNMGVRGGVRYLKSDYKEIDGPYKADEHVRWTTDRLIGSPLATSPLARGRDSNPYEDAPFEEPVYDTPIHPEYDQRSDKPHEHSSCPAQDPLREGLDDLGEPEIASRMREEIDEERIHAEHHRELSPTFPSLHIDDPV